MDTDTEYERRRRENIARNQTMLQEVLKGMGLDVSSGSSAASTAAKRKAPTTNRPAKKQKSVKPAASESLHNLEPVTHSEVRRSKRLATKDNGNTTSPFYSIPAEPIRKSFPIKHKPPPRENVFGAIEGIKVGKTWATRLECSNDGVHRMTVAGIHGKETEGCYSLALSGGYEDDIDLGEAFTYTGEGGRDLKGTKANPKNLRTAPQSKDQTLDGGNKALWVSKETGNPIRVIRGFKAELGPSFGYRYDGLYKVERAVYERGASGFMVWKFALSRLPGQDPLPAPRAHDLDSSGEEVENAVEKLVDRVDKVDVVKEE